MMRSSMESEHSSTSLELCLMKSMWKDAIEIIREDPLRAREQINISFTRRRLSYPLHCAFLLKAPYEVIKVFIDAYPRALLFKIKSLENNNEIYPLNMVLSDKMLPKQNALIKHIIELCPETILLKDDDNLLPIQQAALFGLSDNIIYILHQALISSGNDSLVYGDNSFNQELGEKLQGKIWESIGKQSLKLGEYNVAKDMLEKALDVNSKLRNPNNHGLDMMYSQLSVVCRKLGMYTEANSYSTKAVSIANSSDSHSKVHAGHAFFEKGLVRYKLNEAKSALKYFSRAAIAYRDAGVDIRSDIVKSLKKAITKAFKAHIKETEALAHKKKNRDIFDEDNNYCFSNEESRSTDRTMLLYDIWNRDWDSAYNRCLENPMEAAQWFEVVSKRTGQVLTRKLPLHYACQFNATKEVIIALLEAHPRAVEERDEKGKLPLHSLLSQNKHLNQERLVEIVEYLVQKYPESPTISDAKGMLAIHW